jgi:hypothetical protein
MPVMASAPVLFSTNEGRADRRLRIVAGVVILALGAVYGSWWGLVGFVPFATGLVGFCPLYALLGLNTRTIRTR